MLVREQVRGDLLERYPGGLDALSATVVPVTPDDGDVRRIDRLLDAAYREAMREDTARHWQDRGPSLAWPPALLMLAAILTAPVRRALNLDFKSNDLSRRPDPLSGDSRVIAP